MAQQKRDRQKQHIIFDLDGTLLDTEFEVACITSELAAEKGCALSPEEVFRDYAGMSCRDKFSGIAKACGTTFSEEELAALREGHESRKGEISKRPVLPVNPHVLEVLKELEKDGAILSIGSSNPTERSLRCLATAGLAAYFNARIYGPNLVDGKKKPDPAVFLLAMQENGSGAAQTVVVEDSEPGIEAGKKAGAFTIAYLDPRFGAGAEAEAKKKSFKNAGADVIITDFTAFKTALEKTLPQPQKAKPRNAVRKPKAS